MTEDFGRRTACDRDDGEPMRKVWSTPRLAVSAVDEAEFGPPANTVDAGVFS